MKHNIFKLLKGDMDLIAFHKGRKGHFAYWIGIFSPSFICVGIYRIAHMLVIMKIPILPRMFWWINLIIFGVDIDQRAKLYSKLYLPHPLNIVIGANVTTYGTLKIMQGVTLGGNLGKRKIQNGITETQPKLHGNVFIGIGAIVAGPVQIECSLFIAAYEIVTVDLSEDCLFFNNEKLRLNDRHKRELGN